MRSNVIFIHMYVYVGDELGRNYCGVSGRLAWWFQDVRNGSVQRAFDNDESEFDM